MNEKLLKYAAYAAGAMGIIFLILIIALFSNVSKNRALISQNTEALAALRLDVNELSTIPDKLEQFKLEVLDDAFPLTDEANPTALNETGQKLSEALKVKEFVAENYAFIIVSLPENPKNKLDLHHWAQSADAVKIIREVLSKDGENRIKDVAWENGLDLPSDAAVAYIVQKVYGIALRDEIFARAAKKES